MASVGAVVIDINANMAGLVKTTEAANRYIKKQSAQFNKTLSNMSLGVVGLAGAYAAAQAAAKAFQVATDFTKTAAEFEKFETVLLTIEGTAEKAETSMKWIEDFTKSTPFELGEVTESFIKLRAYGLEPTEGLLKTLGDTGSAMGKSINQAVEAMADAVVGENERLKEFGIKASKAGEQITYNWVNSSGEARTKTIENNQAVIQSTLEAIFNSKYVDAMEMQSKTWNGMLSNMQDSYTIFQKNIMDAGLFDYLKAMVKVISEGLGNAFNDAGSSAENFSNYIIESIEGTIMAFGYLYDSLETFMDYFAVIGKSMEFIFNGVVVGVVGVASMLLNGIEYVIDTINDIVETSLNGYINAINQVLNFMKEKGMYSGGFIAEVEFGDIDLGGKELESWSDAAKKVFVETGKELSTAFDNFTDASSGQEFAKGFLDDVRTEFEAIEITPEDTKPKEDYGDKPAEIGGSEESADKIAAALEKIERNNRDIQTALVQSTGTDYEKFLDSTNNKILDLAKKGASADDLEKIFQGETKKYEDSIEKQTKELMSNDDKNTNQYINIYKDAADSRFEEGMVQFSTIRRGDITIDAEALRENLAVMRDEGRLGVSSGMSVRAKDYYSAKHQLDIYDRRIQEEERLLELAEEKARVEEIRIEMELRYIEHVNVLAESMDRLGDSLQDVSDGLSTDYLAKAKESLFGGTEKSLSFSEALGSASSAWNAFESDTYNVELLDSYNDRMDDLIGTLDEFQDTSKYQSRAEQEFAKLLAFNQVKGFQEAQLDTKEEVDLQLLVLDEIQKVLEDGNITRDEALHVAAVSGDILESGTLETNDKSAISWLSAVNAAARDGVISSDELQSLTNTTNAYVAGINSKTGTTNSVLNSQTSSLVGTEQNTENIGRYKVSKTYGKIFESGTSGIYHYDVIEERYTPYKQGGFTGNYGINETAGVVHGQEYVLNASTTSGLGLNDSSSTGVFGEIVTELKEQNNLLREQLNVSSDTRDNTDRLVYAS